LPPPRSLVEDKARRDVPISVCRKSLTPADVNESGGPRSELYWSTVLPSFGGFGSLFDAVDCLGDVLQSVGGPSQPPAGGPVRVHVTQADSTITPAAEGAELVWFRTFATSDRYASGPLAVMRPRTSELDVYAVGFYSGSSRHSRFELAKLGVTPLVIARDEGCADVKVDTDCTSTISLDLVVGGQIGVAAKTAQDRVQSGSLKDVGRVRWRLTTEPPVFDGQSVRIKEKLSAHDAGDNEVRRSEGERVFTLRASELVADAESIWAQVDRH
jgi:hypothetical protein